MVVVVVVVRWWSLCGGRCVVMVVVVWWWWRPWCCGGDARGDVDDADINDDSQTHGRFYSIGLGEHHPWTWEMKTLIITLPKLMGDFLPSSLEIFFSIG